MQKVIDDEEPFNDEKNKFQTAAMLSLIRRLNREPNGGEAIENLRDAILTQNPNTKCVEVFRSKDGRMQSKL